MKESVGWLGYLLLTFCITLPVSWYALAKVDFFYGVLHDVADIDDHIKQFAPQNRFNKLGFETTTKTERSDLFHQVVIAIHDHGKGGLEKLRYINRFTSEKIQLFTPSEVTHLQDVANLLNKLKSIVVLLFGFWVLITAIILRFKSGFPSARKWCLYSFILIVLGSLILLTGPERVFNQLHVWAFPKDHQWFFYYEESLMSLLMKAPDLFGYIAAIWFVVSALFTMFLLRVLHLKSNLER